MTDTPTIKEELERKTSETLYRALADLSKGIVSAEASKASLQALWDATSGLVSRETMDLIAESIDAVSLSSVPHRRVFVKDDRTIIIALPSEFHPDGQMLMTCKGNVSRSPIKRDDATLPETSARAIRMMDNIISRGYEEIE